MADGRGGGELSVEKTGLSVSHPSILLTAFGTKPMVAAHCCGLGTERPIGFIYCKVALSGGINATSLQQMDLRGRPVGEKIKYDKEPVRG